MNGKLLIDLNGGDDVQVTSEMPHSIMHIFWSQLMTQYQKMIQLKRSSKFYFVRIVRHFLSKIPFEVF